MELAAALVLGIVQGLTEFLPISSSAHLILVPWILGWDPEGLIFDVALHIGTSIAIVAFFWRDWLVLAREMFLGLRDRDLLGNPRRRLAWFLAVGTIPAVAVGLTLKDFIESRLRSPLVSVVTLVIFAVVLYLSERKGRQNRGLDQMNWGDCITIGISQAVALIPGVSRSGITIAMAMWRDHSRGSAARFSFLLSTPVIVGAGMLEARHFVAALKHPPAAGPFLSGPDWTILLTGVVSAAVTGFLCIRYFLRYLQSHTFTPFVIYRIVLAVVVLAFFLGRA